MLILLGFQKADIKIITTYNDGVAWPDKNLLLVPTETKISIFCSPAWGTMTIIMTEMFLTDAVTVTWLTETIILTQTSTA